MLKNHWNTPKNCLLGQTIEATVKQLCALKFLRIQVTLSVGHDTLTAYIEKSVEKVFSFKVGLSRLRTFLPN